MPDLPSPVMRPSTNRTSCGGDAEPGRRHLLEPAADLLARVLDRAAVEVGARRRRRRGRVGDLVGAGRGQPHLRQRDAERGGGDLEHLGVQPLAHLGAAVVDQHRPVLVDVHQRARLVEGGQVERDPELHRSDRQGPLHVCVLGVEPLDLLLAFGEAGRTPGPGPTPPRAARCGGPAGRRAWSAGRRQATGRSCAPAARPGRCRAGARTARGCPRSRSSPAARRSRGTPSATSCWSARSGR